MPKKKTLTPPLESRLLELSRKQLQTLAKLNGVPANRKTVVIVADLAARGVQPEEIRDALQVAPSQSLKYSLRDMAQRRADGVLQARIQPLNQGGTDCQDKDVDGSGNIPAGSILPRVAHLTASEKKARKQFLRRRSSMKFDLEASLARPITWEMKAQTPQKAKAKKLIHDENDASSTPRKRGDYAKHTQLSEMRMKDAKQRRITLEDRTQALNVVNVAI